MGHQISAIVGRREVLAQVARALGVPGVVGLPQGFALVPLPEHPSHLCGEPEAGDEIVGRFRDLSEELKEKLSGLSDSRAIAYVETEYWGGDGTQGAMVWKEGVVVARHPHRNESNTSAPESAPINRCLRAIGVIKAEKSFDEFDSIGLGACRTNEEWAKRIGSCIEREGE